MVHTVAREMGLHSLEAEGQVIQGPEEILIVFLLWSLYYIYIY